MLAWTFSLFKAFIGHEQIVEDTRVICWAAKWLDEDKIIFRSEFHHGRESMIRQMHELLNQADIVIHFNGDTFDIPHLRREFKQLGLPPFSPFQAIDLYKQLKRAMYFPSNKLDNIARQLHIAGKAHHDGMKLWIDCLTEPPADDPNRQKRRWAEMRRYNRQDIRVTEDLYLETRAELPRHPNLSLYGEDPDIDQCGVCESTDLKPDGYAYTTVGKYPKFQCRHCGKYGRSKKAVALIDMRGIAS